MKIERNTLQDLVLILSGCALYAYSMVFLSGIPTLPGNLMGIAVVCNMLFGWSTGIMNVMMTIPTILLGTLILGKRMLIYTVMTMTGISMMTDLFAELVSVPSTGGIFFHTVLAGCIMGIGCGMILYAGGTTGGTTILSRLLVKKTPRVSLGIWMTIMDVLILFGDAIALHDIRSFFYSVLFEAICCKTIDIMLFLLKKMIPERW